MEKDIMALIEKNSRKHFYGTKKSREFYNELSRLGGTAKRIKHVKGKLEVQELFFPSGESTGFVFNSAFTAREDWELWVSKKEDIVI